MRQKLLGDIFDQIINENLSFIYESESELFIRK